MANKKRGFVEIELDGKVRKLRYTLNALAELEDRLEISLAELSDAKMGMKQIRAFLWAGLIHENEGLTESEVGEMVDFENMEYISEKIGEAFKGSTRKN